MNEWMNECQDMKINKQIIKTDIKTNKNDKALNK